jgi:RNA polymerase sigma-70 factor (ECF subfamily)
MTEAELEYEIEMLRRVGRGDQHGFEELYERFSGVLFATAYRVVNDQAAAEDVVQDVFVQIWDKAAEYDSKRGKPLTWMVTMTRNKAIDRLRATQRRSRLHEDAGRETIALGLLDERTSLDDADRSERGAMIRNAVMKLSREQREAIELAFFSGMTQADIAAHLDQPLGTVKARIRRGMLRLRDLVSSEV